MTTRSIRYLFSRKSILDLQTLKRALKTSSRTTVFRALSTENYLTSYSHAGRYYTLIEIPQFDEDGLWAYGKVLFSKFRTLRSSIVQIVNNAPAGKTHIELQKRLRLRVHDTLLGLVKAKRIGRATLESDRHYLYTSADSEAAKAQIAQRQRRSMMSKTTKLPSKFEAIAILVEKIKHPALSTKALSDRLKRKNLRVEPEIIRNLFAHHGLTVKKTPHSA